MPLVESIWNVESTIWNQYNGLWNAGIIVEIINGGSSSGIENTFTKHNITETKDKEEYLKIFLTVHNQFLTEQQKQFIKISQLYPTYKEQQLIKEKINVILENVTLEQKEKIEQPLTKVKMGNIKIGLEKITNYATDNSTK